MKMLTDLTYLKNGNENEASLIETYKFINNFEMHWGLWSVSHLSQTKLLNFNQILHHAGRQEVGRCHTRG